ncbi:MAG: hypothetical protein KKI08_08515 [Armatimonadetes bacterium]|nr:hypothetical protein [Armatimonadota bacterium]
MRWLVLLVAPCLALTAVLAQPPVREPVREGNIERMMLDDGLDTDAAVWAPAEAVLTVDPKHARHGPTSLRLHIDVNWETGEKNYPIGWPRMYRDWPQEQRDWTRYDYLDFSIFTETSRPKLPDNPLGLIVKGEQGRKVVTRELTELRPGEWTDYRLPLAGTPDLGTITGVGFYISESNYKHGDVLDFWIDNMSLVRVAEPTAAGTVLLEKVIAGDAGYLPLDLNVMGVAPEAKADLVWQLRTGRNSAATGKLSAGRGLTRMYLPLPPGGLKPGDYELALKAGSETLAFPLKVVRSAWQEASK